MTVVLANGYAGVLFSFMSVTKLEQPINSIEELASSDEITLLTQSDTELTNRFLVLFYIFKPIKIRIFKFYFIFTPEYF